MYKRYMYLRNHKMLKKSHNAYKPKTKWVVLISHYIFGIADGKLQFSHHRRHSVFLRFTIRSVGHLIRSLQTCMHPRYDRWTPCPFTGVWVESWWLAGGRHWVLWRISFVGSVFTLIVPVYGWVPFGTSTRINWTTGNTEK